MKNKSLNTLDFAEFIEEKGLLAFGEPYVQYEIAKEKEYLNFYLTYPVHGVQSVLVATSFVNNSSNIRKTLYTNHYRFYDEVDEKPEAILLSDFINEHNSRKIYVPNELEITRAVGFVGNESQKKKLTWVLARKILLEDDQDNSLNMYEQEMRLSSIIRSTPDAIGKPEQVAYLSRFDMLSEEDIKEYINLPLEWLYRSLKPCKPYVKITMPRTEIEMQYSPTSRRIVFL